MGGANMAVIRLECPQIQFGEDDVKTVSLFKSSKTRTMVCFEQQHPQCHMHICTCAHVCMYVCENAHTTHTCTRIHVRMHTPHHSTPTRHSHLRQGQHARSFLIHGCYENNSPCRRGHTARSHVHMAEKLPRSTPSPAL